MKKIISILFTTAVVLSLISVNLYSQPVTTLVKVIVAPDHKDWNYKTGEQAKFSVESHR
jgi:cephalosporin-C deacetylase